MEEASVFVSKLEEAKAKAAEGLALLRNAQAAYEAAADLLLAVPKPWPSAFAAAVETVDDACGYFMEACSVATTGDLHPLSFDEFMHELQEHGK